MTARWAVADPGTAPPWSGYLFGDLHLFNITRERRTVLTIYDEVVGRVNIRIRQELCAKTREAKKGFGKVSDEVENIELFATNFNCYLVCSTERDYSHQSLI